MTGIITKGNPKSKLKISITNLFCLDCCFDLKKRFVDQMMKSDL